jgi:hypothetical protein
MGQSPEEKGAIMARIPVAQVPVQRRRDDDHDRRRGIPLWVWPIIPLLLGAIALGLSTQGDDARREGQATGSTDQAPLTDMLTITNDGNAAYVGRQASFADVQVLNVSSDRAFWVGPDMQQQLLVVNESDGAVQVVPGQTVTVDGVIERLPAIDQAPDEWGLTAADGAALASQQVFLRARQVQAGQ